MLIALLALVALAGCGGDDRDDRPPTAAVAPPAREPALLRAAKAAGEIVVRGAASPASHGPFQLHGRYLVRFEQYAPEDPSLDFGTETAFVAALDRRPVQDGRGALRLFRTAARRGTARVLADGRFWLEVSFGDFPYVVRLTPLSP